MFFVVVCLFVVRFWPNLKNKQTSKQTVIFTLSFISLAAVLS